ncbi:sugar-binding protein [soil metagenome]
MRRTILSLLLSATLITGMVGAPATGASGAAIAQARSAGSPVNLDVPVSCAHPDDESFNLSTFGQWDEYNDVKTGVITITRGEGGGNAVGPEEGPPLGLIREAEERRAVAMAGIHNVYNLDKVDFYYNVSAPLTETVWGHDSTLAKVVRVVRMTRPDVIVTMDPSPNPGNHGHHQYAARMAVEAFHDAADPHAFRPQLQKEGLHTWRSDKIFAAWAYLDDSATGRRCARSFAPTEPTDMIYGVWSGRRSARHDDTWAQVEIEAQRNYATQGWTAEVFPDAPDDPSQLGCDYYTLIDSRVPFRVHNRAPTAMLEGALTRPPSGLPLGSELYLTVDPFAASAGRSFTVVAHAMSRRVALPGASVHLRAPRGWTVRGSGDLGTLEPGRHARASFTVRPPADAAQHRYRLSAVLDSGNVQGRTTELVSIAAPVEGVLHPLPHVGEFRDWALGAGQPQLDNVILTRRSIGVGETRRMDVDLHNFSNARQSGTVRLGLPDGFSATPAHESYESLGPGRTTSASFRVTNTDTSLPTSNEGPNDGDYPVTVTTTSGGVSGTTDAALNLVPVTTVPRAPTAPSVNGTRGANYTGEKVDLSRLWEGEEPESPADASGNAKVTFTDEALYFHVRVRDDVLGTVVPRSDAKRHWRTDSVEIAIDPRGNSENTSTTFKVGIFPTTEEGAPAAYRDADNHQGPISETAPGMRIASKIDRGHYDGYTIETKIPFAELPNAVRPHRMGLNIFIYDSDTQDLTGQTRLGWSTWGGVQGDPYRWGHARLAGYRPPAGVEPKEPVFPLAAAKSVASPQTLLQSSRDGVPPGAFPRARAHETVQLGNSVLGAAGVRVPLRATGSGAAHVFAWAGQDTLASRSANLAPGRTVVRLPLTHKQVDRLARRGWILVGWEAASGHTVARAARP